MDALRDGDIVSIQGHEGLCIVANGEFHKYPKKKEKHVKMSNKPAYASLRGSGHFGSAK